MVAPNSIFQIVSTLALLVVGVAQASSQQDAEEARWLVQASKWGTLAWFESDDLTSLVTSIASSDDGRIFFYLTEQSTFEASLTLSEAQTDPTYFEGAGCGPDGSWDPEDPRCAKLTISGVVSPVEDSSKQVGLDALFAAHPQMENWPESHGFTVCEMKIHDDGLWMIANYGGGGYMKASDYHDAEPMHHPAKSFGFGTRTRRMSSNLRSLDTTSSLCYNMETHDCECTPEKCGADLCGAAGGVWTSECPGTCDCGLSGTDNSEESTSNGTSGGHGNYPDFGSDAAGHARWLVAKSLWTTISTVSSKKEGQPFGNIRSVADGACFMGSSGLPYFYLPSPDPTALDIQQDKRITLSFTEAVLSERVGEDGIPCGGKDAEDPTCAKITLTGHAKPLDDDQVNAAMQSFKAQHPRASWLSSGGAHTGGSYYTLHLHSITFLRNYGGFATVTPDEYLNWKPDPSKFNEEATCETEDSSGYSHGEGSSEHTHSHGEGSTGHTHSHGEGSNGYTHSHGEGSNGYTHSHGEGSNEYTHSHGEGSNEYTHSHGEGSTEHTHSHGEGSNEYTHSNVEGSTEQTQSQPVSSSLSVATILLVIFAATVGSFLGGLLSEKISTYCRGGRNQYSVAGREESSLKMVVEDAEAC
jgi:hypothetical protein